MEKRDIMRIAGVTFLLAFSVFATLSLSTYQAPNLAAADYPQNNFCGRPGAVLAQTLYWVFGWIAIAVPVLCALWGYDMIRWGRVKNAPVRIVGGLLFIVSATSLASLWLQQGRAGGIVGELFKTRVLMRLLPPLAVQLTALFLFFVSLLLLTEMRLLDWLRGFSNGIRRLLHLQVRQIQHEVDGPAAEEAWRAMGHPPALASDPQSAAREISAQAAMGSAPVSAPQAHPESEDGDRAPPEESEHVDFDTSPEPMDDEPEDEEPEAAPDARSHPPLMARREPPPPPRPPRPKRQPPTPYRFPPVEVLERHIPIDRSQQEHLIKEKAAILENTLKEFNIEAQVVEIQRGPVITQYELALAPGIKVQRIISLSDDIAMAVKAPSVRIVAPIPGKSTVGIEVPNTNREVVRLRDLFETYQSVHRSHVIPLMLGKDAAGVPLFSDLAQMPHLLIAGATGSGKSVCVNSIILSILIIKTPEEVKLLLVDPKMVELACFKDIPHLMSPVVTDMKRAASVFEWACIKMDDRYALFSRTGVRNITAFNQLGEKEITHRLTAGDVDAELDDVPFSLPHVVIVVDELADLMMIASKEVEASITRLSQKSRAVGIHLILATQRPSVDVITGLIKANLPSRISFKVSSKIDSNVILDQRGAEKLLGMGDMLFLPPGTSRLIRAQGTFVTDNEITVITDFARQQREPDYDIELAQYRIAAKKSPEERDELYPEAVTIVLETGRGSVSLLQRRLEIGYSRAARLIDMMADDGIVGEYKGSQARDILMSLDEWEAIQKAAAEES